MSNKIVEKYKAMPIEDLFGEFSDWYKDVNGVRPRHIAPTDRDSIVAWIINEVVFDDPSYYQEV
ncbi:hypothetical protein UFOVP84_103 [uncultured Caudovirales phage]|uniref:Uncharacterized protein n=1 Tax=uncultured Caudovirales phage TaxID=2100421 RepID=A0A6J5L408_9CAUD|nr:hypothetical protein UFOVP84_103 [uncultured Caudovirales phage]